MSTQLVSRSAELFGGKALWHTEQFSDQRDSVDFLWAILEQRKRN